MASEKTKKLLTNYFRKLTNLSGSNRSIFLPKLSTEQHIDLQSLSQLHGEVAFKIIEALIEEKKKIICPVVDARMESANEASKKLKKLQRLDHFIFEERGSTDLHVGWPMVRGKFLDGTCVRCPLLFFPVRLAVEKEHWVMVPREDNIAFNKSFLLAYSYYNQVKAEEELLEETFEDIERDSTVFRTAIYQLLQKAKLDIHFNPDNYRDELTLFKNFTRIEFEESHGNGQLKLFPEAVLGIFSQVGSYLVPDYQHLLEEESFSDLEDFFHKHPASANESSNFLQQVKEDKVYSIFPLDAWQENALKGAKLGHSLVVQGPPGTGKSQLICNLVSDAMASGKRVLVVCQKRAALDVVYARMKEQNFSEFLSLVHDFKNDRKEIFEKIARQIDRVEDYKAKNITLDAIQLNRKFFQCCNRINQLTEELEEFRQSLFDEKECGVSVKQLYLQSRPSEPAIHLKQEYQYLKFQSLEEFKRRLKLYCHYAQNFKSENYPWRNRKSFGQLAASDLNFLKQCIQEIPIYFESVKKEFSKYFNTELDWEQCEALIDQYPQASSITDALNNKERYQAFQKMANESDEETSGLWLANTERVLLECFDSDGVEQVIPSAQLGQLQLALERTRKARRSLLGLVMWELFSRDKFLVKRALVGNQLESNKTGFKTLERKLDNRLNLEHNLSKLRSKPWLTVPESVIKQDYINWFGDMQQALKAKLIFTSIRGIKNLISVPTLSHLDFLNRIQLLFSLVRELPERKEKWLRYLLSSQISWLTREPQAKEILEYALSRDYDALIEFDRLEESLSPDEKSIFSKLHAQAQNWNSFELEKLFLNSLALAWIDHIEIKHPELRMVSSGKIELLEQELRELLLQKQAISQEIIALRSRESVTDNLEFNRLNNRVTYRDLHHQVTKKRKIWPLRKVIAEFEDEIFRLLPCWLASPESVSAVFPMKELFDLVIFDEASQCFAERGIPALYRGKQAIIAGDSKQLRPGDLYLSRWEEEDENPDQEIDSLLELSQRYLKGVQLQGHYRSQSLELIDFSNKHFYNGKLQLLPDRLTMNKKDQAIDFLKVEGQWKDNANQAEADKVAELVWSYSRSAPRSSIGVVTFNAPQQSVVLDAIEDLFQSHQQPLPDNLFVKNIENVQGDERDIIIFSIGYAADKKGKISIQFGSLNVQGGENRLNVAVTRAKQKIVVVCSLWPEQLNVEDTKNEGPKLLKKYLMYAQVVASGNFVPFKANKSDVTGQVSLKSLVHSRAESFGDCELTEEAVPFYDLTVKKSSTFASAILTDDRLYYESLSSKSLHGQVPLLLEQKNWPFFRFYSRNYWQDRDRFLNEIGKWVGG